MAEIKFSPEAIEDLKHIKAYIAEELLNPKSAGDTAACILYGRRNFMQILFGEPEDN